jgi:hypothetical protein
MQTYKCMLIVNKARFTPLGCQPVDMLALLDFLLMALGISIKFDGDGLYDEEATDLSMLI